MGVLREAMQREMALRGFAPKTEKAYLGWMVRLSRHSRLSPELLRGGRVKDDCAGWTNAAFLRRRSIKRSALSPSFSAAWCLESGNSR